MVAERLPEADHFVPVELSNEPLDYADLETLDYSLYDEGHEARKGLAAQLRRAMTTQGFFVVVNHGITEKQITRQVDIGHTIFKHTPPEEKDRLTADILGKGEYPGFKPRGHWKAGGKPDRIENFNVNRDMSTHKQPKALEPYRSEIQGMVDTIHKEVLGKTLRLFAIALEIIDEEFFVKLFDYDKHDESWARWMQYYADKTDTNDATGGSLWLGGHQDLSALSLLFSQPMASLQVRNYEDSAQWKYTRHVPGAIVVNAGEIMMWWTGDYFKAAVHRVIQPPRDQRGHDRSGFYYFAVPNDDVVINTLLEESPVLRANVKQKWFMEGEAPTSKEWCNNRIRVTGQKALFQKDDGKNTEQEKIGSVVTTWYR
jgi:isopenicillin N synthase-like dioxygenase